MSQIRYLIIILLLGVSMVSKSESEMSFNCDEPKKQLFDGVSITLTHCIDSSGPDSDGAYGFYYDYETIIFELGNESVSGKRYADTPEEASLIRITDLSGERLLETSDFKKELVKVSVSYLIVNGAKSVQYLDQSNTISGYSEVPSE
ncbi:hypothetical protein [Teredinibacter purpureus]|uniref:hypothetical protein n=1 Tax=Teredinibacter purpureus TaxID=2731756 RepID=UPI0005F77C4A|nr:hypothetical protein [Teredinibacter purpureus]